MVMKAERKFTWCIRYYNVKTNNVGYYMHYDWTVREINEYFADFVASHKDCIVRVFKLYKTF